MKIEGNTVTFKSKPDFFYREEEGKKPNTERLMSIAEFEDFKQRDREEEITQIKIAHTQVPEAHFTRSLTDVCVIGDLLGLLLVVFSWEHEQRENENK